jgi:hypothetical protein
MGMVIKLKTINKSNILLSHVFITFWYSSSCMNPSNSLKRGSNGCLFAIYFCLFLARVLLLCLALRCSHTLARTPSFLILPLHSCNCTARKERKRDPGGMSHGYSLRPRAGSHSTTSHHPSPSSTPSSTSYLAVRSTRPPPVSPSKRKLVDSSSDEEEYEHIESAGDKLHEFHKVKISSRTENGMFALHIIYIYD